MSRDFIGKIIEIRCDKCNKITLARIIYLKEFSTSDDYEYYSKCLDCEGLEWSYCWVCYLPIPDEPDPIILGLDYLKFKVNFNDEDIKQDFSSESCLVAAKQAETNYFE